MRAYNAEPEHKIKKAARDKAYHTAHREVAYVANLAWREAHPEAWRGYQERYRERHREAIRERHRLWAAKERQEKTHHVRVRHRQNENIRRTRKTEAGGSFTTSDLERLWATQKGRCPYCGRFLSRASHHIDHRVPVSKGGSSYPSNLCLCCPACNMRKHTKVAVG